jgi:aspartate ammonia-lyase
MCANEVIANRGLELMGHVKGEYEYLHPIDDVNRSQSTNDVYPTAIKLGMVLGVQRLFAEHKLLAESFAEKGREFQTILKVGRTQLQDAVPMTLGQEFGGFATTSAKTTTASKKPSRSCVKSTSAPPRLAPVLPQTPATPKQSAPTWPSSPVSTSGHRLTSLKRPVTRVYL